MKIKNIAILLFIAVAMGCIRIISHYPILEKRMICEDTSPDYTLDIKATEGVNYYIKNGTISKQNNNSKRASSVIFSVPNSYNYMMIEANPGYAVNMYEIDPTDNSASTVMSWENATDIMRVNQKKQYIVQGAMKDIRSDIELSTDGYIAKLYLYKDFPYQFMYSINETIKQPQLDLIYSWNVSAQGLATDGKNILICYPKGALDLVDLNTKKRIQHKKIKNNQYGHMNDATYYDGAYYVTSMLDTGEIYKFDANTLELLETFYAKDENGNPCAVWRLSYDKATNSFFSANNTNAPETYLIYDTKFNLVDTLQLSGSTSFKNTYSQSMTIDEEFIYECNTSKDYQWNYVVIHRKTGEFVGVLHLNDIAGNELEGIAYDWDHHMIYVSYIDRQAGRRTYQVLRMNFKPNFSIKRVMKYLLRRLDFGAKP